MFCARQVMDWHIIVPFDSQFIGMSDPPNPGRVPSGGPVLVYERRLGCADRTRKRLPTRSGPFGDYYLYMTTSKGVMFYGEWRGLKRFPGRGN
jgi:hypothetical protein